jgi:predicted transcriptional regulator
MPMPHLQFREAVVLDRLQQRGPLTSREIHRALGLGRRAAEQACLTLSAAGLVVGVKRAWGQGGPLEWGVTPLANETYPPRHVAEAA